MDARHTKKHFVRAVMEGITYSLNEILLKYRQVGKQIEKVVSIGGGAKNSTWLQIQADIFNIKVVRLQNEQGPALGAAMIAAYGLQWEESFEQLSEKFLQIKDEYVPILDNVIKYNQLFKIYQTIYQHTKDMNEQLVLFR